MLKQLEDIGFVDRVKNIQAIVKCNYDIQAAANYLAD